MPRFPNWTSNDKKTCSHLLFITITKSMRQADLRRKRCLFSSLVLQPQRPRSGGHTGLPSIVDLMVDDIVVGKCVRQELGLGLGSYNNSFPL